MGSMPYINDKRLYAAVMGAIKYIRETGYFNKAVEYHAAQYDVDVEEIKKYIRIAQSNGQKGRKRGSYKYYAIQGNYASERGSINGYCEGIANWRVIKASKEENAIKRLSTQDDYSEYGSQFYVGICLEFDTKEKAESYIKCETEKNYYRNGEN